ncbi:MAG: hypothetical protein JWS10_2180 [Cypionkella sp.]|uniref:hypothetical protein n=1 Tax=Cypionkella sp. TaxID=2811411 RepID=UPI00262CDAC1|nr:hypothetical protein [Cypionkella sp.]MDB5659565.1 hypothetical protein [Cypionkella sp.]
MNPLAAETEFTLSHGGNTVRLRASLRSALRLERLHDGFGPLITKLDQFDTATIGNMIKIAATDHSAAQRFLASISTEPLQVYKQAVTGTLSSLLAAFLPTPATDTTSGKPKGKTLSWSEAYAQLYQIGTGWLGWTPAETWHATPTEITEALTGHIARLEAINGTTADKDDTTQTEADRDANIAAGLDPTFDRAGFEALRLMTF